MHGITSVGIMKRQPSPSCSDVKKLFGMARVLSRRFSHPSFVAACPSSREGAGKAGHRLMPMVRVQKKSTRQNHRFSRGYPAFPAQWF
jgi:hypothetical protein